MISVALLKAEIELQLSFNRYDGMLRSMKIMSCFLILLLVGCTEANDPAPISAYCASPRIGFHSLHDPNFVTRWPVGIEGYQHNTVKIKRNGALSWNGTDLATMHDDGLPHVEQFLTALGGFPAPQPFTILDFEAGAPCDKVEKVRELMVKHLGCTDEDLCFQGSWTDRFGT